MSSRAWTPKDSGERSQRALLKGRCHTGRDSSKWHQYCYIHIPVTRKRLRHTREGIYKEVARCARSAMEGSGAPVFFPKFYA